MLKHAMDGLCSHCFRKITLILALAHFWNFYLVCSSLHLTPNQYVFEKDKFSLYLFGLFIASCMFEHSLSGAATLKTVSLCSHTLQIYD